MFIPNSTASNFEMNVLLKKQNRERVYIDQEDKA
jgi:hypothetical protein